MKENHIIQFPIQKNRGLYEKYKEMASKESKVCFVGRLASYKYFNMDQAFLNALEMFDEFFSRSSSFRTHLGGRWSKIGIIHLV